MITLCRSGARSRQAAALLARDHHQIYNVVGGTRAWVQAGMALQAKGWAARAPDLRAAQASQASYLIADDRTGRAVLIDPRSTGNSDSG